MGFKTKVELQKYKKARYAIGNVSEKDLFKIIKDFEKIEKLTYCARLNQFECSKNMKTVYPDENNVVQNENSAKVKKTMYK